MNSLLEVLEIELEKQLEKILPSKPIENVVLYHYTDFNGLKGIIENQCLFATNSSFLNDKNEYYYGVDIFRKLADVVEKSHGHIERRLARSFNRLIAQKSISNRYVTSFSQKGDLLSQWRAYANNGKGIAIGFDAVALSEAFSPKAKGFFVEYHEQEKLAGILFNCAIDYYTSKKEEIMKSLKGINITEFYNMSAKKIYDAMDNYIGLFKDKAFDEEMEYRFELTLDKDVNKSRELFFRAGNNNLLMPYLKLVTNYKEEMDAVDGSDKGEMQIIEDKYLIKLLPIKEIMIGPSVDFELNKASIELLLGKNGYDAGNIKIDDSKVPYRI